jgi:tetratricopeptide (TPR) repeat protein
MGMVGMDAAEKQKGLIHRALSAKQSEDYVLAAQLYDEAITMGEHGYLSQAYYSKGVLAMEVKRYDQALHCFQKAVGLTPEYEKAWVNLGCVLLTFDRHEEALYAFEKAHNLVPDQAHLLFNRAYSLNRLGRYREAHIILKNLTANDEMAKEVAAALNEDGYKLYSETGLCSLQLGDLQNALHFFRRAFNLNTSEYQVCYNLAYIYDSLRDFDQAILFYDLSIALDPNEYKGYQGKACTYIHMRRYDDALQLITRAINISPDNFEAYYNLACIYAGQRERENMINAIHKTIELAPPAFNVKTIFRKDEDFSAFNNDPGFLEVTS